MKVLVTGGTNGMGKAVASFLSSKNHEVIILCRNKKLGLKTLEEFEKDHNNKKNSMVLCDLTKLSDVKNAIAEIHEKHEMIDGVFVNAGIGYSKKRILTENNMDRHFQVNYLSQFMLVLNILDMLEKSENGGRVIFNTTVEKQEKIFWKDLQLQKKWSMEKAILQAMGLKRMFAKRLSNIYQKREKKISFVSYVTRKIVMTNQINIIPWLMRFSFRAMKGIGFVKTYTMDECGEIIGNLFVENMEETMKRNGKIVSEMDGEKGVFEELKEKEELLEVKMLDNLWETSVKLCNDKRTKEIAEKL